MARNKGKSIIGVIGVVLLLAVAGFFIFQQLTLVGGAGHSGRIYNQFGQGSFDLLPESGQIVTRGGIVVATLFLDCGNCGGTVFPTNNPHILTLKDETGQVLGEPIKYDKGTDRNQGAVGFWSFTFNSSKLSAGNHVLYVETSGNPSIDSAKLIEIITTADYRSVPTWGQNPLAYLEIFVEPAVCNYDPQTEGTVSLVLHGGETTPTFLMKEYPTLRYCDLATKVQRADTGEIFDDYQTTYDLSQGKAITIPPSQVREIIYVAKKTWGATCTGGKSYNLNNLECLVSGLIRPCGDIAYLKKDGTCLEVSKKNCVEGTYYNASINPDACIIDRAPKGDGWLSQWEDAINAFAIRIPLTKVCEGHSPSATYQTPAKIDEKGKCLMPDNSFRLPKYDCSPYSGSFPAMKDEIYYCQFGAEQLLTCEIGETTENACVTKIQLVDKVIIDEKVVERQVLKTEFIKVPINMVLLVLVVILGIALIYAGFIRK